MQEQGEKIETFTVTEQEPAKDPASRALLPGLSTEADDSDSWQADVGAENEAAERRRDLRIVIVWAILVMLVLTAGVLYFFLRKTRVPLNEYIHIQTEGIDTIGTAAYQFDAEAFLKDYGETIRYRGGKANVAVGDYTNAAEAMLLTCVNGSLDRTADLANGDTITFRWECNDSLAETDYHCMLIYSPIEYSVMGLKAAEVFDPFDGIEVSFHGTAPNGRAQVDVVSEDPVYRELEYHVEPSAGLQNGDTVTITVTAKDGQNVTEHVLREFGKTPSALETSWMVDGLTTYATRLEEIPDLTLQDLRARAEIAFQEEEVTVWKEGVTLLNREYLGAYFLTPLDAAGETEEGTVLPALSEVLGTAETPRENMLYLVYAVDVSLRGSTPFSGSSNFRYYTYTAFFDLACNADGSIQVDENAYETPSGGGLLGALSEDVVTVRQGWRTYTFPGYDSVNDLYLRCVDARRDLYACESTL